MKKILSILILISKAWWFLILLLFVGQYTPLRKFAQPDGEPILEWWVTVLVLAPVAVVTGLILWLAEQINERDRAKIELRKQASERNNNEHGVPGADEI